MKTGCLFFVLLPMLILALISAFRQRPSSTNTSNPKAVAASTPVERVDKQNRDIPGASEKIIPEIMPVDVYLALEKEGFSTAKELNPCCTWYSSLGGNSPIIMTAETHGYSPSSVYRINARVVTTIDINTKEVAKPFMGFLATLQYSGSQPELAREWVEANIGKRASKRFGSALITLDHGSDNALMMSITPD